MGNGKAKEIQRNNQPRYFEDLQKAMQTGDLLLSDISEAHKKACHDDLVLEILLRGLIKDVVGVQQRLSELESSVRNSPAK
jgi:hypothetical protein